MISYIFLGPPGAGKGTQAKILSKKLGAYFFGMGDEMREEAAKGTELGKKFKAVWDQGRGALVQPDLVTEFFASKISSLKAHETVIFDGYPRSIEQAHGFEKYLPDSKILVIDIQVNHDEIIKRLSTRRICPQCDKVFLNPDEQGITSCDVCRVPLIRRQEDAPEIVKKRIEVYEKETQPMVTYFAQKHELIKINGNPSVSEVEQEIWKKVNERANNY